MISSVSLVSSSTLPPLLPSMAASTATRGSHQTGRNLIRVLKATLKGPQRGSQRPTSLRPHQDQGLTTSAGDHARFSPQTGLPAGRSETSLHTEYSSWLAIRPPTSGRGRGAGRRAQRGAATPYPTLRTQAASRPAEPVEPQRQPQGPGIQPG